MKQQLVKWIVSQDLNMIWSSFKEIEKQEKEESFKIYFLIH